MAGHQFSLVVAMYNVAEYLPAFLESLRVQRYPLEDLDIVVVDDGSVDDSAELVERWRTRHHPGLRLIRQENAGPGAARNAGLELAQGEWVTFCDPDDVFHPGYFEEVAGFLAADRNASAQLLATRLVQFKDGTADLSHTHPLGRKFRLGNVLADLDANPELIQLHGPTAFLKRAVLREHALRFDPRVRPKFEDAHLIGRYLAAVEAPVLGIVATARYYYRRNRRNGSSLVAGAWADPRAYEELPRYGYLGLLEDVRTRLGRLPAWAQYMVLYDLVWFYIDDKRMHSQTAGATDEQRHSMHRWLERIFALIDHDVADTFSVVSQGWVFHNILKQHYQGRRDQPPVLQQWDTDEARGMTRYSYLFTGDLPEEKLFIDGRPAEPVAAKIRDHRVLGRTLIRERILILPVDGQFELVLDGVPAAPTTDRGVPFQPGRRPDQRPGFDLLPAPGARGPLASLARRGGSLHERLLVRAILTGSTPIQAGGTMVSSTIRRRRKALRDRRRETADARLISAAGQEPAVSRYANAWVLMDRIDRADDNAEHLYRYLIQHRPDINAWFLLDAASPDWDRLAAEGFRLVPYGSDESVLLLLNADFKISSHANANIEFPISRKRFGEGKARFVFLQHGITKDDMSRWLNMKNMALMITASPREHESIVGDGTEYSVTANEVALTGFPRHDALARSASHAPVENRSDILIAPTWREYLRDELADAADDAERLQRFEQSPFGRAWLDLLRSPDLADHCARKDRRVVFLPHPELESIVPLLELPAHVTAVTYRQIRVQEQLVKAHTLITDYSSIAFDAAFGGARVLYLQPEEDDIFSGGHVYRKGYFDYRQDGLGPVTRTVQDAMGSLAADEPAGQLYARRRESTFAFLDQQACARVTAAIEQRDRRQGATG